MEGVVRGWWDQAGFLDYVDMATEWRGSVVSVCDYPRTLLLLSLYGGLYMNFCLRTMALVVFY
jgi:hypothetical protein